MNNFVIKQYQDKISQANSKEDKLQIASQLHDYVRTLSETEREAYKTSVKSAISSKMEVMDKLLAAYEAMKKDDLHFA
jgi:molecular chaperone GrpE (heat shock protein)